jgi:hypothetical protein
MPSSSTLSSFLLMTIKMMKMMKMMMMMLMMIATRRIHLPAG